MTTRELITAVLEKKGEALTIDELVRETHIPASKLRNVLTPYSYDIVRVGHKIFDLAYRVYPGKKFRYRPNEDEIKKGIISICDDLYLFLTTCFDYMAEITLIDQKKNVYTVKRSKSRKQPLHFTGLKKWYRETTFKKGDDILFTCIDLTNHTYSFFHERKECRDEFAIAVRNRELADMVFDILNHSVSKYESDLFLVRKYLFIYPFEKDPPPDQLVHALSTDKRFLISKFNKMLSWTGHWLDNWLTIGLRKYYYQDKEGAWVPVSIITDKFGRYGFCTQCSQRMVWSKHDGWQHINEDSDYVDTYLDKTFFQEGLQYHN